MISERRRFGRRAMLVSGAVAVASAPLAFALRPTTSPSCTTCEKPTSPYPPFGRLAFEDDFTSLTTIDVANTRTSDFNWYVETPFQWNDPLPKITQQGSTITINPVGGRYNNGNWSIATVCPSTGAGKAFQFGYFECLMRYGSPPANRGDGWPSFWALAKERMVWDQKVRYAELDFYEAAELGKVFNGSIHDWTWNASSGTFTDRMNDGTNLHPGPKDPYTWHRYGCLWEPGHIDWYLDGILLGSQRYGADVRPTPNGPNHPVGTYSILDAQHLAIVIGNAHNWPLEIDWVRIWQP